MKIKYKMKYIKKIKSVWILSQNINNYPCTGRANVLN